MKPKNWSKTPRHKDMNELHIEAVNRLSDLMALLEGTLKRGNTNEQKT